MKQLTDDQIIDLQSKTGYTFGDIELLHVALQPLFKGEVRTKANKVMEYLGDRLLGAIIITNMYEKNPKTDVETLCHFGQLFQTNMHFGLVMRYLCISAQLPFGGENKDKTLADVFECLCGAIWLDCKDFEKTGEVIIRIMRSLPLL
jgi:dsRNA-specific ribonuclease